MSGLYIGVKILAGHKVEILYVTDEEERLTNLIPTQFPDKHYDSPITILQAVLKYREEEGVDCDTRVIVRTKPYSTLASKKLTVRQLVIIDKQRRSGDWDGIFFSVGKHFVNHEREMDAVNQQMEDQYLQGSEGGGWNPPQ